ADVVLERAADAGADIGDAREAIRELAASVGESGADSGPEPNAGAGAGD
ncbi:cobalamin biosynthesis CbiX protein, partial [Natrinema versiforme JCM 10478]